MIGRRRVRRCRAFLAAGCAALLVATLTSCTPETPVAYHVTDSSVDIAFCEYFKATSVEIEFSNYGPPGSGGKQAIAERAFSGDLFQFVAGRSISSSMDEAFWTLSRGSDKIPADWDRVDYTFYGPMHNFVAGEFLFSRDVVSDQWAWARAESACELRLNAYKRLRPTSPLHSS